MIQACDPKAILMKFATLPSERVFIRKPLKAVKEFLMEILFLLLLSFSEA